MKSKILDQWDFAVGEAAQCTAAKTKPSYKLACLLSGFMTRKINKWMIFLHFRINYSAQTATIMANKWLPTCSGGSVAGSGETVPLGNDNSCNAQHTDDCEVDETRLRRAVEGVVKPGYKRAHDQQSNARVVQSERERTWETERLKSLKITWNRTVNNKTINLLGESARDFLRMAVDSVKKPGEAEAQHCTQEEHPEHHLLLQRGHEVHIGP